MIIQNIDSGYKTSGRMKSAQKRAEQEAQRAQGQDALKNISDLLYGGGGSSRLRWDGRGSSRPRSARATIKYLSEAKEGHRPELLYSQHIAMTELAAEQMENTASHNRRIADPIMHTVISWGEGEQPKKEQMIESVQYYLEQAGYKEHEAVAYFHTHNGKSHVQICYNRVHPETYKGVCDSFRRNFQDYKINDRVARELEIKHNFNRTKGVWTDTEKDLDGRERVVVLENQAAFKKQRNNPAEKVNRKSLAHERASGLPSFERYVKTSPDIKKIDKEVKQLLKDNQTPTWMDIHEILDKYDLNIKPVKSGYVIFDSNNPEVCVYKASAFSRELSAGSLNKSIGIPFQAYERRSGDINKDAGYSSEVARHVRENALYKEYSLLKSDLKKAIWGLNYDSVKKQSDAIKRTFENKIAVVKREASDMRNGYFKQVDGKMQFVKPNVKKQIAELRQECKKVCAEISKEFKQAKAKLDKSPASGSYREYLYSLDKTRPDVASEIERIEKLPVTILIDKRSELNRDIDSKQQQMFDLYDKRRELIQEQRGQGSIKNLIKGTGRELEAVKNQISVAESDIDKLRLEREQVIGEIEKLEKAWQQSKMAPNNDAEGQKMLRSALNHDIKTLARKYNIELPERLRISADKRKSPIMDGPGR